jgi:hypothetical protein
VHSANATAPAHTRFARRVINAIATLVLAASMLVLAAAYYGDTEMDCDTDTDCAEKYGGDGGPAPGPGPAR